MNKLIFAACLIVLTIGLTGCTKTQNSPFDGDGHLGQLTFDPLDKKGMGDMTDSCDINCPGGSCSIICEPGLAMCGCDFDTGMPLCNCY